MNRILARFFMYALLAGCALLAGAQAAHTDTKPDEVVKIMAGNSKVYAVDFKVAKVATGDPKIFGVVQSGDSEMIINAIAQGGSNLIIWGEADERREILINVLSPDLVLQAEELRGILSEIEGVQVNIVGKRIVVEGQLFKSKDHAKINQLLAGMPDVVNLTQMSPFMKKIMAAEIERSIGREGILVKVAKNAFLLEGVVPNDEEGQRAEKIALAYSPNVVNALVSASSQVKPAPYEQPKLIEVHLTVMEIDKSALKNIGIYWNPDITTSANASYQLTSTLQLWPADPSRVGTFFGALAGVLTEFIPKMRRIHESGKGRSLMQQTIITKEGGRAEFFAGSEQPIAVAQDRGVMSVEYKKVGMTLNVIPQVDPLSNIDTVLEIESSSVTGQNAQGAPIVRSNIMATAVNVEEGVTIVLGGLAGQRELKAMADRNPNNEPTLFQLNYDRTREMTDSEVLVFITPRVVRDVKMASREIKLNATREFKMIELQNLRQAFREKYN